MYPCIHKYKMYEMYTYCTLYLFQNVEPLTRLVENEESETQDRIYAYKAVIECLDQKKLESFVNYVNNTMTDRDGKVYILIA